MAIDRPEGEAFIKATIGIIEGKWKLLILWYLRNEPKRFGELNRLIPEVSEKVLTQQLRALEKEDIIRREPQPGKPPSVKYAFTEHGRTIIPLLQPLCDWGEAHLKRLERKAQEN